MKYLVKRNHLGDGWYPAGAFREARESDVAHLVERGVLERAIEKPVKKAAEKPKNKAARSFANKAAD